MVDEAVVDLWQWVEAKSAERKPVPDTAPKLKQGQTWGPKYGSIADILAEYDAPAPEPLPIERDEIAALVDALTAQADVEF